MNEERRRKRGNPSWEGDDIRTEADGEGRGKSLWEGRRGNPYMEGQARRWLTKLAGGLKPLARGPYHWTWRGNAPPRTCGTSAESSRRSRAILPLLRCPAPVILLFFSWVLGSISLGAPTTYPTMATLRSSMKNFFWLVFRPGGFWTGILGINAVVGCLVSNILRMLVLFAKEPRGCEFFLFVRCGVDAQINFAKAAVACAR